MELKYNSKLPVVLKKILLILSNHTTEEIILIALWAPTNLRSFQYQGRFSVFLPGTISSVILIKSRTKVTIELYNIYNNAILVRTTESS